VPNETITHFYNEIVFLTAKIGELGLPNMFIQAAKKQDETAITVAFGQFQLEQFELWTRMCNLYQDYVRAKGPVIFGSEQTEEYYKYNPDEIDPLNLCFLLMFSKYDMSDWEVFGEKGWEILSEALLEKGHVEMSNLAKITAIGSLEENLMEAFQDNQ